MDIAIVLFSGGLDSTTCLYLAKQKHRVIAVSFDYGQKHIVELTKAKNITQKLGIEHVTIKIDNSAFSNSALTTKAIDVPDFVGTKEIPVTYVPARNTIFIAYAMALAETRAAKFIYLGISSVDYSGYPDCRAEYVKAYQDLIDLAIVGHKLSLVTPLINLTKAETIRIGLDLGIDYSETISCYRADANGIACGTCDSCVLRNKGFADLI